jgi:hypothetical protein
MNVWIQVQADCSRQTGMEEDWRLLHPAVDVERLKMMMMMMNLLIMKNFNISKNRITYLLLGACKRSTFSRQCIAGNTVMWTGNKVVFPDTIVPLLLVWQCVGEYCRHIADDIRKYAAIYVSFLLSHIRGSLSLRCVHDTTRLC